jgi:predicted nucleic acid-binding protein
MNVLVDTSVWIDHFRHANASLIELLNHDRALTHPMIVVEIACGTVPAPRSTTLSTIRLLRDCNQATLDEVAGLIERETLFGLGCGLVDFALLASTLITPNATLWTMDKRLNDVAVRFGIAHVASIH